MHRARAFFFVCLGILCLVAAYHFGATSATAQAPSNPVVAADLGFAYTANGDCYKRENSGSFTWVGNVFGGSGPVSAQTMSMGQLKAKYATPATTR